MPPAMKGASLGESVLVGSEQVLVTSPPFCMLGHSHLGAFLAFSCSPLPTHAEKGGLRARKHLAVCPGVPTVLQCMHLSLPLW